ncbi:hypothetical protein SAMN04488539_2045 [Corynebacterium timonense]|uniref:ATPase AAA-type core domain-containing protein n=2 Tax=Corynebacterium timonense TaxID=441500 RepID=A0A1H1TQU7_9CORY|nr:hypothetical protein SAMN04488539_2045 [Corynebacterium timonense]
MYHRAMLLSLAVENYRSFGKEAVLDMQRRSFKTLRPRKGESWTENTWRRAGIFGPNASGKSNILLPLSLLRTAIIHSLTSEAHVRRLRDPHMLQQASPTRFDVEYVANDVRYRWILVVDNGGVVSESLDANERGRFSSIFNRERNEITFGQRAGLHQAAKENIEQFLRSWSLVFSAWATVKNPGRHAAAIDWWGRMLPLITGENDRHNGHQWLIELAHRDPHWLGVVKTVIRVADVGVRDVGIEEAEVPPEVRRIQELLQGGGDSRDAEVVKADDIIEYLQYLRFEHHGCDQSFYLDEADESLGTRTWLDLAVPALFALAVGGVLAIDEIDSSLHPLLVRELVSYFDNSDLNPLGAQLLFGSHDTSLIGRHPQAALHHGEVWFATKSESRSELVALDEFAVREAHNVEKRYLQGVYGAVPIPGSSELVEALAALRRKYGTSEARGQ